LRYDLVLLIYVCVHDDCMNATNKECVVERGDGSYDSTSLFLYIRQLL
jgi:hypothetical protein